MFSTMQLFFVLEEVLLKREAPQETEFVVTSRKTMLFLICVKNNGLKNMCMNLFELATE